MAILLPPSLSGPVYTFSTVAKVSGALKGATVQAFKNGVAVGNPGVADNLGFAVVTFAAGALSLGDALTATQSKDGAQSQRGPGTTVLGVPGSLAPPIFLSRIHTCMDAVLLGGLQVGALVEITSGGTRLGDDVVSATEMAVSLVRLRPLAVGAILEARQTLTQGGQTLNSSRTPSLPAEATPVLERTLPAPQIVAPLFACDLSVLVSGIFDGMQMQLETSDGGGGIFSFGGNAIRAGVKPLKEGVKVKAKQFSQNCNFDSLVSNEVTVGKPVGIAAPHIIGPICTGLGQVVITNLVSGAEVNLYAGRDSGVILMGTATAAFSTQTFGMPDPLPAFPTGPAKFLVAFQSRCGVSSGTVTATSIDERTGNPLAPGFLEPVECSRFVPILCTDRAFGCALQILSDDPATPILSPPIVVTQDTTVVYLYRQLKAGENITAVLTGCGAGPAARRTKSVGSFPLNKPSVIEPLRSWQKTVLVTNTLVGAQVYLFINGKYSGHVEAMEGRAGIKFPVDDLNPEDKVTAVQTLCAKISDPSNTALVTSGEMVVSTFPDPIIRGPNPQTVIVVVKDLEDRHDIAGTVQLPLGVTKPTNTPFSWVFPLSTAGPAASVTAPDYIKRNVVWNLKDPAPVPPPTPASMTFELVNQVPNVILKKAEWDISRVMSLGAGPTQVDSKTGNPASSNLPQPAGTQDFYFIGCTATFEYAGATSTAQKMVAPLIDFVNKATVGWQGKNAKAVFLLKVVNGFNDQGQIISEFYIQLAEVKQI